DTALQYSTYSCAPVTTAAFTINGTVTDRTGNVPLANASVSILAATGVVKTVSTLANGTFAATGILPGTYNIRVTKSGYTFANPAVSNVVLGPNQNVGTIHATAP